MPCRIHPGRDCLIDILLFVSLYSTAYEGEKLTGSSEPRFSCLDKACPCVLGDEHGSIPTSGEGAWSGRI